MLRSINQLSLSTHLLVHRDPVMAIARQFLNLRHFYGSSRGSAGPWKPRTALRSLLLLPTRNFHTSPAALFWHEKLDKKLGSLVAEHDELTKS